MKPLRYRFTNDQRTMEIPTLIQELASFEDKLYSYFYESVSIVLVIVTENIGKDKTKHWQRQNKLPPALKTFFISQYSCPIWVQFTILS